MCVWLCLRLQIKSLVMFAPDTPHTHHWVLHLFVDNYKEGTEYIDQVLSLLRSCQCRLLLQVSHGLL